MIRNNRKKIYIYIERELKLIGSQNKFLPFDLKPLGVFYVDEKGKGIPGRESAHTFQDCSRFTMLCVWRGVYNSA